MTLITGQNENTITLVVQSSKRFSISDVQKTILNNFGWFQRRSLFILSLCQAIVGFSLVTQVFVFNVPNHFCDWKYQNSSYESCTIYSQNHSCTRICSSFNSTSNFSQKHENGDTHVEKCSKWIYDLSYGETIVTQFNLVCESSWRRPVMQCMFMIGLLIGSVVGGHFTDKYGRRAILSVAVVLHGFTNLTMAVAPNYWLYQILFLFTGLFHVIMFTNSYVLGQEMVPDEYRSTAALYVNTGFACGCIIVPAIAFLAKNWFILVMCSSIGSFLFLPLFWILPESQKWLYQNGKYVNFKQLCIWIAKYNKIEINQNQFKGISESPSLQNKKQQRKTNFPSLLFKVKVLRKRIIIICFLWNVWSLGFFTMTFNTSNLGGNIYLNCFFASFVDLGSYYFMALLFLKLGRRSALLSTLFSSSLFCFLTPFLRGIDVFAGIASALCAKFFITTVTGIVLIYTGELFPTLIRNTSMGIASMSARFASAATPFLIYLGESVTASIPFYAMGGLFLLASFCVIFLPETSNVSLPDTVEDAIEQENTRWLIKL